MDPQDSQNQNPSIPSQPQIQQVPMPVPASPPAASGRKKYIVLGATLGIFVISGVGLYGYLTGKIFSKAVNTQKVIEKQLLQITGNKKTSPVAVMPTNTRDFSKIDISTAGNSSLRLTDMNGMAMAQGKVQNGEKLVVTKPESRIYYLNVQQVDAQGVTIMLYHRNGEIITSQFFVGTGTPSARFKITFNKDYPAMSNLQLVP
ncbi:MAG: hypothetical protein ACM3IJ_04995 [Candidatus Levyibacteriota bacterium]